jgi:hypothetical protein
MGSWGEGPFENDAAMDFLRDLEGKSVGAGLERAFEAAVRDDHSHRLGDRPRRRPSVPGRHR